jgi:hypothetical protein
MPVVIFVKFRLGENFREYRLIIFISAQKSDSFCFREKCCYYKSIFFVKTANIFRLLTHLLPSYTYFHENFPKNKIFCKKFRKNLLKLSSISKKLYVSHVADSFLPFIVQEKSTFVTFRKHFLNFRIVSQVLSRNCVHDFRKSFHENVNTKNFVSTLVST